MVKKKRSRRRRLGRFRKRIGKAKIPFETLIGAGAIPFTPAQSGWGSPFEFIQTGNFVGVMDSLKSGFLGMDPWTGQIDFASLINPFSFEKGRYVKMLVGATLVGMVRKKLVGRYTTPLLKKIPFIGRWVS